MQNDFDGVSHDIEGLLPEIRRLLSETVFLTDDQEKLVAELTRMLAEAGPLASTLRRSLLGEELEPSTGATDPDLL